MGVQESFTTSKKAIVETNKFSFGKQNNCEQVKTTFLSERFFFKACNNQLPPNSCKWKTKCQLAKKLSNYNSTTNNNRWKTIFSTRGKDNKDVSERAANDSRAVVAHEKNLVIRSETVDNSSKKFNLLPSFITVGKARIYTAMSERGRRAKCLANLRIERNKSYEDVKNQSLNNEELFEQEKPNAEALLMSRNKSSKCGEEQMPMLDDRQTFKQEKPTMRTSLENRNRLSKQGQPHQTSSLEVSATIKQEKPTMMASLERKAAEAEKKAEKLLIDIGIYPNKKGYSYLRRTLIESELHGINGSYSNIAKEGRISIVNIERDIRVAIHSSYDLGKLQTLNNYLGSNIIKPTVRPSTKQLISLLSDFVYKS